MKHGIHPDHHLVVYRAATTGAQFITRSTAISARTVEWTDGQLYPLIVADITSDSYYLWTGIQRIADTAGRVEKFERKYGRRLREGK